jgi:hypothetical protein
MFRFKVMKIKNINKDLIHIYNIHHLFLFDKKIK